MRSKTDDGLNDYIESLENYFLELKANNTLRLIFKLDEMNGIIADDIDMIIRGEDWESSPIDISEEEGNKLILNTGHSRLKILSDDKDSKVFDRIMVLYTKLKDLKLVTDYVATMLPEIDEPKKIEEDKSVMEADENAFEKLREKVLKKGGK